MRYIHDATRSAKNKFVNQMSFIIEKIVEDGVTQRELAHVAKVSPNVISNIKFGRVDRVSFDVVKRVADALRLEYSITVTSRFGKATETVTVQTGYEYMRLNAAWQSHQAKSVRIAH